jgi:Na+-translocating ferredoxin:NAD+ oxidoreductase RNF subunit RnfB
MANKWMPAALAEQCSGGGLCVDACTPKFLTMVDGIAVLAFPETCGREEHCISACRDDAIQMARLPFSGDPSVRKWSEKIEQATSAGFRDSRVALE